MFDIRCMLVYYYKNYFIIMIIIIKIIKVMQDAKEILEFNKFMRKRLMEFYRLTKCPVPHSSMLFKRRKSFQISSERSYSTAKDYITVQDHTSQRFREPISYWCWERYIFNSIIAIFQWLLQPSIGIYRLHYTPCNWGADWYWIEYSEYGKCSSNLIPD